MADAVVTASSRLDGDWSAPAFARSLTPALVADAAARFDSLDPLVRVRMLLAAMHAPPAVRDGMQEELRVRGEKRAAGRRGWRRRGQRDACVAG